jgi:hypothetical protein
VPLKQTYYQVIPLSDYEACLWGVYIDPDVLANVVAMAGQPVLTDAILMQGQVITCPPLDNPPSSVMYIPAQTADLDEVAAKSFYREGIQGKLSPADQAKQVNVSFNVNPGRLVGVSLTYENRNGTQIVHADLQPEYRKFDLGPMK